MTKKEYIKEYCDGCMNHSNCAYRNRGMQCHLVDNIDDIWDACKTDMIDKAWNWFDKHINEIANPSPYGVVVMLDRYGAFKEKYLKAMDGD